MYKKLVKFDGWCFAEVDPVCLKRTALVLRDLIVKKFSPVDDPYNFLTKTLPIVEAAIRGEITESIDQEVVEVISANYDHERREGTLPAKYDNEFTDAIAGFALAVGGMPIEEVQEEIVNGVACGWMNCEEEGDWPDKVPYP